jgi:hypothetical protein
MRRHEDIILHIKRVDNEPPKPRLKFSESLARKIRVQDDNEISKRRQEFEIELLRVTLGISPQAAEYLLQQHGRMALVAAGRDYQEPQFVAWLESSHARLFHELSRLVRKDLWESRLLKLAKHFVPKNAREERLGDLQEVCDQLTTSGCGKLKRRLVTAWRVLLIAIAQLRITVSDLLAQDSTV